MSSDYRSQPGLFDRVHDFVVAGANGELTADQWASFEQLLRESDDACRLYFEYVEDSDFLQTILDAMREEDSPLSDRFLPEQQKPGVPSAPTFLSATLHGTAGFFSSGWPVAYLIATAICGVGMLIGSLTHVSGPEQMARQSSLPSRMDAVPKMKSVGRITGMVDCKWAGTAVDSPGVPLGRKYELASGLMEIAYDTGAKVILQGPVTYQVESASGGYLSIGKLTGKVTAENAKGFAVRTPTAVVTDLGTEFGVEVSSEGATEARVFVGKVQIAAAGGQQGGNRQTRTICAGQFACVGSDMVLSSGQYDSADRAKQFTRIMPAQSLRSDAYAELVLSMNPVVYYRMDQWPETDKKGCYVLVDSAPGAHHGVACLDEAFGKPSGRGKFGGALDLHGTMGSDYAFVKNYPKPDKGKLSVSVWVWPVVLDPWAGIVSNWYHPLVQEVSAKEIGQFGLGVNGALELVAQIRQPDGKQARVCELGRPLPRSQWHHVAFVADGAVLRLYRNGVEIGAVAYHGIASQPVRDCLSVGCGMNKDGMGPRPENAFVWNGRLDELAVFNHALSAEQVRQLYTAQANAANTRTSP